jgi:hypothetical protein
MAYSTSSSERCQEKESMPLQAWPRSPNWGHSACQDAAVASADDFPRRRRHCGLHHVRVLMIQEYLGAKNCYGYTRQTTEDRGRESHE